MIKNVEIVQKVSAKGNPYYVMRITTENGYSCDLYLTPEQHYCLTH